MCRLLCDKKNGHLDSILIRTINKIMQRFFSNEKHFTRINFCTSRCALVTREKRKLPRGSNWELRKYIIIVNYVLGHFLRDDDCFLSFRLVTLCTRIHILCSHFVFSFVSAIFKSQSGAVFDICIMRALALDYLSLVS